MSLKGDKTKLRNIFHSICPTVTGLIMIKLFYPHDFWMHQHLNNSKIDRLTNWSTETSLHKGPVQT